MWSRGRAVCTTAWMCYISFPYIGPHSKLETFHTTCSQPWNVLISRIWRTYQASCFLISDRKWNLSRSLDSWKFYWYARPLNERTWDLSLILCCKCATKSFDIFSTLQSSSLINTMSIISGTNIMSYGISRESRALQTILWQTTDGRVNTAIG